MSTDVEFRTFSSVPFKLCNFTGATHADSRSVEGISIAATCLDVVKALWDCGGIEGWSRERAYMSVCVCSRACFV